MGKLAELLKQGNVSRPSTALKQDSSSVSSFLSKMFFPKYKTPGERFEKFKDPHTYFPFTGMLDAPIQEAAMSIPQVAREEKTFGKAAGDVFKSFLGGKTVSPSFVEAFGGKGTLKEEERALGKFEKKREDVVGPTMSAIMSPVSTLTGMKPSSAGEFIGRTLTSPTTYLGMKGGKQVLGGKKEGIVSQTYDRILKSTRASLKGLGPKGVKLADKIDDAIHLGRKWSGGYKAEFRDAYKAANPSKEEFTAIVDAIEGNALRPQPGNRLRPLYDVIERQGRELGEKSAKRGLKVASSKGLKEFEPMKQYYPHSYTEKTRKAMFAPENETRLKDLLIQSGQAKNPKEASSLIKQLQKRKSNIRISEQHARETVLPGYEKTPEAWIEHLDRMGNRLAQAQKLGVSEEKARSLIAQLADEGQDVGIAQQALDRVVKAEAVGDTVGRKLMRTVRGAQSVSKLSPRTSVLNYFQRYSVIPRTNLKSYWKARKVAFTDEGWRWAVRVGEVDPKDIAQVDSIRKAMEGISGSNSNVVGSYLKLIGMEKTEIGNRLISANAGKLFAQDTAHKLIANPSSKVLRRAVKSLGLDADTIIKRGLVTESDMVRAAQSVSKDTQFWYGVMDLPISWTTEGGKLLTQFKPAGFQQMMFVKEHMFKEAARGNIKPLISGLTILAATGEATADIRQLMLGRDPRERTTDPVARMLENLTYGSGFGLAADTVNLFLKGHPSWVKGLFFGPTGADVVDYGIAGKSFLAGEPRELGQKVVGDISRPLQRLVFPYKKKKKSSKPPFKRKGRKRGKGKLRLK